MADSETARVGEADGFSLIDLHDSDDCLLPSSSEAKIADNIARGAISILAVILRILAAIYYFFLVKNAVQSREPKSSLYRPPLADCKADSHVASLIKGKVDRTAKLPSSGSNLKTPSKVSLKGEPQPGSSQLSACLQSTTKLSSDSTSGGPCSDIDAAQSMQVHHGRGEQEYEPCASAEPEERKRDGKFNPRESLDWDSACFNSAGLLDPDELSYIIEKTDSWGKPKHSLPGIEEELSRLTDWISIFASDNLSLESLEADLFRDMRASIQRCSKASSLGNSNSKQPGNVEAKCGRASKTIELPYANTVRPKLASKMLNPGTQGLGKTIKLRSLGAQVNKAAVQSRESMSSHRRPPLASGKPGSQLAAPIKRLSVCTSRVKADSMAAGMKGSVSSITKVPNANAMPKTTTSAKTLGPSTIKKTGRPGTRTSCVTSCSCTSSLTVTKTKVDRTASGSNLKTPSKVSFTAKPQSGSLQLSAYLQSTTKLSSSTSTASSIIEWSTESSVSSATVNQKTIDLINSTFSGHRSDTDAAQTAQVHHGDGASTANKNSLSWPIYQSAKQTSAGNVSLPHSFSAKSSGPRLPSPKIGFFNGAKSRVQTSSPSPSSNKSKLGTMTPKPAARNAASAAYSKPGMQKKDPMRNGSIPHLFSAKPSGLRLPSPKIGFFDGAKTGGDTPGGSLHSRSGLSSFVAKSGAQTSSSSSSSNKSKLGTTIPKPAARNAASSAYSKLWVEKKDPMKKVADNPQKGSIFSQKSTEGSQVNSCRSDIVINVNFVKRVERT